MMSDVLLNILVFMDLQVNENSDICLNDNNKYDIIVTYCKTFVERRDNLWRHHIIEQKME